MSSSKDDDEELGEGERRGVCSVETEADVAGCVDVADEERSEEVVKFAAVTVSPESVIERDLDAFIPDEFSSVR